MKKIKFVICLTVFGFFFSLIIGLFSKGVTINWAFLRAFLFSFLFCAVGIAFSVFYEKFIQIDSFDENISSQDSSNSEIGQNVNLVTPDEPLQVDSEASQFYVGNHHQMLNQADFYGAKEVSQQTEKIDEIKNLDEVEKSPKEIIAEQNAKALKPETSQNQENVFVPITLAENAQNISGVEATSKSDYVQSDSDSEKIDNDLDALPDLSELQEITESSPVEDSFDGTSDFSTGSKKTVEDVTEGKDVSLIAKAISTVLTRDSQK